MLTTHIQELVPQCMLFAYSIVLVGELKEEINAKLEKWRQALEAPRFCLSRNKMMYLECKFSKRHADMWFRYLGATV